MLIELAGDNKDELLGIRHHEWFHNAIEGIYKHGYNNGWNEAGMAMHFAGVDP